MGYIQRLFTILTITLCAYVVESYEPDKDLCPDISPTSLPVAPLPVVKFPQNFATTLEVTHWQKTNVPDALADYSTMMKAVRGERRGTIKMWKTDYQQTTIYDFERKQKIDIETHEESWNTTCQVTRLDEDSDWIIGEGSTGSHVPDFGSAEWLFRYDPNEGKEVYLGKTTKRGIPVNQWRVCSASQETGTVVAQHYWSDPFQWTPLIGKNKSDPDGLPYVVPVAIDFIARKGLYQIHQVFSFFMYDISPASETEFDIQDDVYCDGLSSEGIKLPTFHRYFSFNSEIIIQATPGDVITNQKHLYDSKLNLTRLDFSLALDNSGAPTNVEQLTYIEDFERMISFLIDRTRGTCTIERITENSGNIKVIRNGTLSIADPYTALHKGADIQKLIYYKQSTDRGIQAQVCNPWYKNGGTLRFSRP